LPVSSETISPEARGIRKKSNIHPPPTRLNQYGGL
jgi:hypothetical protein